MATDLYVIPYSFKSLKLDTEPMMRLVKEIGFDGVEGGSLTPEYLELLDKYGLKCVNFRVELEPDGTLSDEKLRLLEQYNQGKFVSIVDPNMGAMFKAMMGEYYKGIPGAFGTFEGAKEAAEKANENARILGRYGLSTLYHNHTHEFRVDHGEYVMDTYLRHTDDNIKMEFDVGWGLTAGIDPIYWMGRWHGRIGALHIKSCNWALSPEALGMTCPVPPLEIGISQDQKNIQQAYAEGPQGPMEKSICDWRAVINAARDAGCGTFIIERERIYNDPQDIVACLQADHDYIRSCLD